MMQKPAAPFLCFFFFLLFFNGFAIATHNQPKKVYIVYLGEKPHDDHKLIKDSHHDLLATVVGSKEEAAKSMLYSYRHGFSGFSAKLTESQAKHLAGLPGVVRVIGDKHHEVKTTRSWDFLGLTNNENSPNHLLQKTNMGDGIIIGVIDTGILGTSPSFSDEGMGEVPKRWKGVCKSMGLFNETEQCNRKVIGARWFVKGALHRDDIDIRGLMRKDDFSPLDSGGHGTQIASIAAGSFVYDVNFTNMDFGGARGGAPRAHLAIYKACWNVDDYLSCSSADILAAFDLAVHDGVDVISVSIGLSVPLQSDVEDQNAIGIGSFHAVAHGIPVVVAAGNDGPSAFTVTNVEPWLITVAASTLDRAFIYPIALGNGETIMVDSYSPLGTPGYFPLSFLGRYMGQDDLAQINFNKTEVVEKVVFMFGLALDEQLTLVEKAAQAGAFGVIYANPAGVSTVPRSNFGIPCVQVDLDAGTRIKEYIYQTDEGEATVQLGFYKIYQGRTITPKISAFSSRGPNSLVPTILKPDVAAPGDRILCATVNDDPDGDNGFVITSGTSHAVPHVTGIVALLRASHPEWSPAAIKSAIVTTAWNHETYALPIFAEGSSERLADAFDFGGGIANPNGADDPGLVYDMGRADYIEYDCSLGYNKTAIYNTTKETHYYDSKQEKTICPKTKPSTLDINLPSIVVPDLQKSAVTIQRTVTNVGAVNSVYKAVIKSPLGTSVSVKPNVLRFDAHIKSIPFTVKISSVEDVNSGFTFGSLTWTDGVHHVRSPIAVRKQFMPLYF